ncbi:unnamed protein product [Diabrotica balteata]|uniref:Uncharacterized protein n=1 Tax=Diabrotica balteata TaxID=107213 RepID=A0A9N9SZ25_DIABA|nr:unnamed protein product [Diabrotica balteata]
MRLCFFFIFEDRIKEWSTTVDNNTTDMLEFENKSLEGLGIITTNVSSIVPEIKHGVIIVFHGSPNTEYYKAANQTSKTLGMKMVSIDQLIFEELLQNQSEHASEINKKINDIIDNYVVPESDPLDDEYDVLAQKVETILDGKKIGKKNKDKMSGKKDKQKGNKNERSKSADDVKSKESNKSNGDKSSTKASKSSKSTKSGKTARGNSGSTFLDIHPQTFANLLKVKLEKMKPTIVIESLNSAGDNEELLEKKKKPGSAISKEKLLDGSVSAISKRIAKEIPKYLEREFALSNTLLLDICEFAEHWDRRHGVILKAPPFNSVKNEKKHKNAKQKKGSLLLNFTPTVISSDLQEAGIPILIINNAGTHRYQKNIPLVIQNLLKKIYELKYGLEELNGSSTVAIKESSIMYSVLKNIKRFKQTQSDLFKIEYLPTSLIESSSTGKYSDMLLQVSHTLPLNK